MKKLLFFFLVLGLFSCQKDSEKLTSKDLIGTWELYRTTGFAPTMTYPPGNGQILIIGAEGQFERKENNAIVFRGYYSLDRKKDCYERNTDVIFTTNETSIETYQYVAVKEGLLTLSTPNCMEDGSTTYYKRIKP